MKKLLPILILVLLYSVSEAQTAVATPVAPPSKNKINVTTVHQEYFCCRMCDYTALTARSCPVHQSALVKVGSWYCPVDGKTSLHPGNCTHDNTALVRMEMKFKSLTPKPAGLRKEEPVIK